MKLITNINISEGPIHATSTPLSISCKLISPKNKESFLLNNLINRARLLNIETFDYSTAYELPDGDKLGLSYLVKTDEPSKAMFVNCTTTNYIPGQELSEFEDILKVLASKMLEFHTIYKPMIEYDYRRFWNFS